MKIFYILSIVFVSCSAEKLVGGWTEQDPNDPQYMEMAWGAIGDINADHAKSNDASDNALVPKKVLSAQTQVVAGMNYRIDVEVGESDCTSNEKPSEASCSPKDGGDSYTYTINKFEQPWTDTEEVTVAKKMNH